MIAPIRHCAVFGATSYVGQFLIAQLTDRGVKVTAVTRSPAIADILLRPFQGRVRVCTAGELGDAPLDTVLNLAYVRQSIPVAMVRRNRALVDAVHRAALRGRASRVLHVSSAAVFGYRFRQAPRPGPAPRRVGDSYVELKADAERWLLRKAARAGYVPVIVRPGNILGPGSPVWLAGPAQRILSGRPVALTQQDGFSNSTYVRNLADYLVRLAEAPAGDLRSFGTYHHVAEFSEARWSLFLHAFAQTMGVPAVLAGALPGAGRSTVSSPWSWAARAYRNGPVGVWMRRVLGRLPFDDLGNRMFLALKTGLVGSATRSGQTADAADANYLAIVSERHEFRSHTLSGWYRPTSLDTALREMNASLVSSGFALGALPSLASE